MGTQTLGFYDLMNIAEQNSEKSERDAAKIKFPSFQASKNKKVDTKSKMLSEGIQKFLAKKDEEKRKLEEQARLKRENLLKLRSKDKKAKKRVNQMLRMTKSANKAAMQDAVNSLNDSIVDQHDTLQPDDDDYGYGSQASQEMHNKLLEKYKTIKRSNPVPQQTLKSVPIPEIKCLGSSKLSGKSFLDGQVSSDPDELDQKVPKKPPAPAINYHDLLILAEEKKSIPPKIRIPKLQGKLEEEFEFGRPMTAKEKSEYLAEKGLRERVARQVENGTFKHKTTTLPDKTKSTAKPSSFKIPTKKPSGTPLVIQPAVLPTTSSNHMNENSSQGNSKRKVSIKSEVISSLTEPNGRDQAESKYVNLEPKHAESKYHTESNKPTESKHHAEFKHPIQTKSSIEPKNHTELKPHLEPKRDNFIMNPYMDFIPDISRKQTPATKPKQTRKFSATHPRSDIPLIKMSEEKIKRPSEATLIGRKEGPPSKKVHTENSRPPHMPNQSDISRPIKIENKNHLPPRKSLDTEDRKLIGNPSKFQNTFKNIEAGRDSSKMDVPKVKREREMEKPKMPQNVPQRKNKPSEPIYPKKGRNIIQSDEEEEDVDSEMDDFIDDSEYSTDSISAMIRKITGYDKRRYLGADEEECMETSAYDQMREETRSLRIGIREDMEDMKLEEEEKKRKMLMKQKLVKASKKKV